MKTVPMSQFGRDHWNTLCYIETRCVDYGGKPNVDHMRCNPEFHAELQGWRKPKWLPNHGTRLKGFVSAETTPSLQLKNHDDWHCAFDLQDAGLIKIAHGPAPMFCMTVLGWEISAKIRKHKGIGGGFADFEP